MRDWNGERPETVSFVDFVGAENESHHQTLILLTYTFVYHRFSELKL